MRRQKQKCQEEKHHVGIQPRFTRIEAHRYRSPERKAKKVSMKMDKDN